ncbi:hypothetical protein Pelo_9583 [Pelomyxa schiedti]|nr:hypothetical protein Pelo_9583 [Pelomyxa schiedti]
MRVHEVVLPTIWATVGTPVVICAVSLHFWGDAIVGTAKAAGRGGVVATAAVCCMVAVVVIATRAASSAAFQWLAAAATRRREEQDECVGRRGASAKAGIMGEDEAFDAAWAGEDEDEDGDWQSGECDVTATGGACNCTNECNCAEEGEDSKDDACTEEAQEGITAGGELMGCDADCASKNENEDENRHGYVPAGTVLFNTYLKPRIDAELRGHWTSFTHKLENELQECNKHSTDSTLKMITQQNDTTRQAVLDILTPVKQLRQELNQVSSRLSSLQSEMENPRCTKKS